MGADEDDVFYQAEASRGLGMAYYELKQYDKAIEIFEQGGGSGRRDDAGSLQPDRDFGDESGRL